MDEIRKQGVIHDKEMIRLLSKIDDVCYTMLEAGEMSIDSYRDA